jgi:hypothetical protein
MPRAKKKEILNILKIKKEQIDEQVKDLSVRVAPASLTKIQRVNDLGELVEVDLITGRTIVLQDLRNLLPAESFQYTTQIADIIAGLLREGHSIPAISELDGMPRAQTIYGWRRRYPDFGEKVRQAIEDSAYVFADKTMKVAAKLEEAHKDEVPGLRGAADQYRWAAEKYNPEQFGQKTKVSGDSSAPINIIIDTGIRRNDNIEATAIEAESRILGEEDGVKPN